MKALQDLLSSFAENINIDIVDAFVGKLESFAKVSSVRIARKVHV